MTKVVPCIQDALLFFFTEAFWFQVNAMALTSATLNLPIKGVTKRHLGKTVFCSVFTTGLVFIYLFWTGGLEWIFCFRETCPLVGLELLFPTFGFVCLFGLPYRLFTCSCCFTLFCFSFEPLNFSSLTSVVPQVLLVRLPATSLRLN